jgi:hypothetical protein
MISDHSSSGCQWRTGEIVPLTSPIVRATSRAGADGAARGKQNAVFQNRELCRPEHVTPPQACKLKF